MMKRKLRINLWVWCLFFALGPSRGAAGPPPELSDARVNISYTELKALVEASVKAQGRERDEPSVASQIARADYILQYDEGSWRGQVRFLIDGFGEGWKTVPLLGREVLAENFSPVEAAVIAWKSQYALHFRGDGRQLIEMNLLVKPSAPGGSRDWVLPTAPAVIQTLEFQDAPAGYRLLVEGAQKISSRQGADRYLVVEGASPRWSLLSESQTSQVSDKGDQSEDVKRVEIEPAVISTARVAQKLVAGGALRSQIAYDFEHHAPLQWKLALPRKSSLLDVRVNGKSYRPIDRGEGLLEFYLPASPESTRVSLTWIEKGEKLDPVAGELAIELPLAELLIEKIHWDLELPSDYGLRAFEGNVRGISREKKGGVAFCRELSRDEKVFVQLFYQKNQEKS